MKNIDVISLMKDDLNALFLRTEFVRRTTHFDRDYVEAEIVKIREVIASMISRTFYLEQQFNEEFDPNEYDDWELLLGVKIDRRL